MRKFFQINLGILFLSAALSAAVAAENPFLGGWALTHTRRGPGLAGGRGSRRGLEGRDALGVGQCRTDRIRQVEDGKLVVTRNHNIRRREGGKRVRKTLVETITATVDGDASNWPASCPARTARARTKHFLGQTGGPDAAGARPGQCEIRRTDAAL